MLYKINEMTEAKKGLPLLNEFKVFDQKCYQLQHLLITLKSKRFY